MPPSGMRVDATALALIRLAADVWQVSSTKLSLYLP